MNSRLIVVSRSYLSRSNESEWECVEWTKKMKERKWAAVLYWDKIPGRWMGLFGEIKKKKMVVFLGVYEMMTEKIWLLFIKKNKSYLDPSGMKKSPEFTHLRKSLLSKEGPSNRRDNDWWIE